MKQPESNRQCVFIIAKPLLVFRLLLLLPNGKDAAEICGVHCKQLHKQTSRHFVPHQIGRRGEPLGEVYSWDIAVTLS